MRLVINCWNSDYFTLYITEVHTHFTPAF